MTMQPDRDQIEMFVDGLFRHASPQGFVSLRAFYEEDSAKAFRINPTALSGGLKFLIDVAEDDANRAANHPKPVVFCPPIAVFANKDGARERDIAEGLALSVECDQHPHVATIRRCAPGSVGPCHAGAVIVPAVLAACERHDPDGRMALTGIAVGTEVLCRLSLVVPKAVHKAGFHPTAIFGAMGAAAGVGAALGLDARQIVDALGITGSMAGGIIEYLAEGAWTKRLHAGWAAQSGIRAALLARQGFVGPRTVFEGVHGLFHGFAHTTNGDYAALTADFGNRWVTDTLAFKPYPCGTMAQPYIDCARRLAARGIKAEDVSEIVCEVAEGTVHRLWEPLADKQRPRNGYAAKFATPYLLAAGFIHGGVGLGAFTQAAIGDAGVLALAAKVKFVIDPDNPYPNNYTGHIKAIMKDGSVIEERQPHLRGGAREPLTRQDLTDKFALNTQHGGWDKEQSEATLKLLAGLYQGKIDLSTLRK